MRAILLSSLLLLAGCGGPSIENSSDRVNDQVNAVSAGIEEGSGRNDVDPATIAPGPGRPGVMPQEPPRGGS